MKSTALKRGEKFPKWSSSFGAPDHASWEKSFSQSPRSAYFKRKRGTSSLWQDGKWKRSSVGSLLLGWEGVLQIDVEVQHFHSSQEGSYDASEKACTSDPKKKQQQVAKQVRG